MCPPWWSHWGVRPFWKYVCWPGIVCGGLQKDLRQKGPCASFLCGLLFAFANPPLQTPDEADHYLRTYAISTGHFDFDASRTYPDDVAYLLEAFPGAWVNAHTSAGVGTDPDTGAEKAYNTAGYALKQYGKDGAVQSMADSFALYLAHDVRDSVPDPVSEPVSFLVIPFLPGAVGMALARLLSFGALGCYMAGASSTCWPTRCCARWRWPKRSVTARPLRPLCCCRCRCLWGHH